MKQFEFEFKKKFARQGVKKYLDPPPSPTIFFFFNKNRWQVEKHCKKWRNWGFYFIEFLFHQKSTKIRRQFYHNPLIEDKSQLTATTHIKPCHSMA